MGDSPGHCYWVYLEDGSACFIPGCYGGIYGPEDCNCFVPGSQIEQLQRTIDRQAMTIRHFEQARGQRQRIREWYEYRIARLMARLDKYEPRTTIRIDPE